MYLEPQIKGKDNEKKQTRAIPTEKFYNGKDSFSDINRYGSVIPYSFTNTKYWYTSEGSFLPEHNFINKFAYEAIIDKETGEPMGIDCKKNAVRNMGKYYYIAVGPKVIHKNYPSFGNPGNDIDSNGDPTHIMYNNGTIDIVVKDFKDTLYHIRAVVGDIKAHTYDNGIVQTYHSYPDGALAPKEELPTGKYYDGLVCAEFIFKTDNYFRLNYENLINTLGRYEIVNIIFYPNDNYIASTETTI